MRKVTLIDWERYLYKTGKDTYIRQENTPILDWERYLYQTLGKVSISDWVKYLYQTGKCPYIRLRKETKSD